MAPKKNAYTLFVEERCRVTKEPVSAGYGLYGADWQALDASEKEKYSSMAKNISGSYAASLRGSDNSFPSTGRNKKQLEESQNSWPEMRASLKMADLKLNVPHGVGEFKLEERYPNLVKDFPAFDYSALEEMMRGNISAEYPNKDNILLQQVVVIGCVPVVYMDKNLTEINRPLEIAVECFKIGLGYSRSLYHAFVDPGELPPGSQLCVKEARQNYHRIPASKHVKSDDASKTFHQSNILDNDYYTIYHDLLRTVAYGARAEMRPLLTGINEAGVTWASLRWLHQQATVQGTREGLPDLPLIKLATLEDFCINIFDQIGGANIDEMNTMMNTYRTKRYKHYTELRCPFHREVDSEECARGSAHDKIYLTFDILRGIFKLPTDGPFVPPQKS